MARYMSDKGLDETSTWTRATQAVRDANRTANYKLYHGGPTMEEFPFASTNQGGPGAYLAQMSIDEQRAQGRLLATSIVKTEWVTVTRTLYGSTGESDATDP